jgi:hypothetical protein
MTWLERILGLKREEPPQFTLTATVTRADGTVEELGVIAKGDVTFSPEAKS